MVKSGSYKVAAVLIIASFIIPCRFDDSLNTGPSSDNIFDEHAKVQLQKSTYPLNENSLVDLKRDKIDTDIMLDRKVNPMAVANVASMVLGVVTGFMSIFDFIKGKTASKDKHSLDDVMATLDKEFSSINNQLNTIFDGVTSLQLANYKDVEIAVRKSMTAMKYNNNVENDNDANTLYTKLHLLMDGMLGNTAVMPNIVKVVVAKQNCNYNRTYEQLNRIINLVNIGGAGLSYYYAKLNRDDMGKRQMKSLSDKRDIVESRMEAAEWDCVDPKVMNPIIESILATMQSSQPCDVVKKINKELNGPSSDKLMTFYAVWKWDPNGRWNSIDHTVYRTGNVKGVAENGGWKVYWSARRKPDDWSSQEHLQVKSSVVKTSFNVDAADCEAQTNMYYLIKNLIGQRGREPRIFLTVCNAPQYACGAGDDIYYERFRGHWTIDVMVN